MTESFESRTWLILNHESTPDEVRAVADEAKRARKFIENTLAAVSEINSLPPKPGA